MSFSTGDFPVRGVHIQDPWLRGEGTKTKVQTFFEAYAAHVDCGEFKTTPPTKFYSPKAVFVGQNSVIHNGAAEIGAWMRGSAFGIFSQLRHTLGVYHEILPADSEADSIIFFQAVRNIWLNGSDVEGEPDVSVPMLWLCTIGKADSEDGFLGLQMKRLQICWDTAEVVRGVRERGLGGYQGVE